VCQKYSNFNEIGENSNQKKFIFCGMYVYREDKKEAWCEYILNQRSVDLWPEISQLLETFVRKQISEQCQSVARFLCNSGAHLFDRRGSLSPRTDPAEHGWAR